jgi:hypothetical protein
MKSVLRQIKSPYGIKKSLKWLFDYMKNGDFNNPLGLKELPDEIVLSEKLPDQCLLFMGDLMGTTGKKIIIRNELKMWASDCDSIFGNLEGPIWDSQDIVFIKQHNSIERIKELSALAPLKKWIFGLANNHANDYGLEGLANSKKSIEALGAQWFGTREKNKIICGQVEIFAAATFSNIPSKEINHIENLEGANLTEGKFPILFLHWGTEFAHFPDKDQKKLRMSQLSKFKFLVGHHSHTPQPIELDSGLGTAYSLGNLYVYFNKKILKRGKLLKLYFSAGELCRISWRESEVKSLNRKEIEIGLA